MTRHISAEVLLSTYVSDGQKVTVAWIDGEGDEQAVGLALCDDDDKFDPEIGRDLALGRALQYLGRKLERRANGKVKHQQDVRAQQEKAAGFIHNGPHVVIWDDLPGTVIDAATGDRIMEWWTQGKPQRGAKL